MLYAIVGMLVIILDQWVKYWVSVNVAIQHPGMDFIPGVLSLVNVHNDGAAFGILSGGDARIYFIILTGVFTVAVILMLATGFIKGRVARWSIALVTAGGLSNCIDRVIYGYVQDMFKVELFDFAVFNVADIFITVFCLLFALAIILEKDPEPEEEDDPYVSDDEQAERPSLFGRRRNRDEEEEAEEEKPAVFKKTGGVSLPAAPFRKKNAPAEPAEPAEPVQTPSARKPVRRKYDEEYEQYKAKRAAQAAQGGAPVRPAAPAYDPADPFAEWEKANARVEAQQKNGTAVSAGMPAAETARPVRPAAPAAPVSPAAPAAPAAPARPAAPVRPAAPAAPARPAAPAAPAAPVRPAAPAAKPKAADDEFDIDSILAEFK